MSGWQEDVQEIQSCGECKTRAEQGEPAAQFKLAGCYANGSGVKKNPGESLRWARAAAEQNFAKAQFHLGTLYQVGESVEKDPAEAASWYRKAAGQNFAEAQFYLGSLYQAGAGVKKDAVEAYAWYALAAWTNKDAAASRDNLEKSLSPQQLAEARKRANELETEIEAKVKADARGGAAPLSLKPPQAPQSR